VLRCILFDAGNTLVHLDYPFIAGVLAEHGHPTTVDAIRVAEYAAKALIDRELAPAPPGPATVEVRMWQPGAERPSYFGTVMRGLGVPGAATAAVLAALETHNRAECLWRIVEPDTTSVLEALRARGLVLGVVSNADGRIAGDLAKNGLGTHFETVIDSHVVGVEKPDPAIFHLALAALGMTAAESLYVGDVFGIDVVGARRAGLDAVLLDTLGQYPGGVDCRRIHGLAELLDLPG
jgi:putative hydrolase of the HAD superfamily